MNRGDCFFCKAPILQVFLDDGTKIHDTTLSSTEPNERSNHRRSWDYFNLNPLLEFLSDDES